jgi:cell wall-associated NlpC family hydrolase
MKNITRFLIIAVLVGACAPYPRYSTGGVNTPREEHPDGSGPTTNDYIRLGSIVQGYLGKPYAGRSRYDPGLDCSLFTQEVIREYARIEIGRTVADQNAGGMAVPRNRMMPGDLVFFRTERDRVSHVGLYMGSNEFCHASSSQGIIMSNLSEPYWAQRFEGARRVMYLPDPANDDKDKKDGKRDWEKEYRKRYGHK